MQLRQLGLMFSSIFNYLLLIFTFCRTLLTTTKKKTYNLVACCCCCLVVALRPTTVVSVRVCVRARARVCVCAWVCNKNKRQKTMNSVEELTERTAWVGARCSVWPNLSAERDRQTERESEPRHGVSRRERARSQRNERAPQHRQRASESDLLGLPYLSLTQRVCVCACVYAREICVADSNSQQQAKGAYSFFTLHSCHRQPYLPTYLAPSLWHVVRASSMPNGHGQHVVQSESQLESRSASSTCGLFSPSLSL